MSARDDSLKTTGRLVRGERPRRQPAAREREAPVRMDDPRRRYTAITMFAVLVAVAFLLAVVILVAPGRVADAGLRIDGMIWGLLVLKVFAAAMIFTWVMFMINRNGKRVRQ